jgi:hypothetical protein
MNNDRRKSLEAIQNEIADLRSKIEDLKSQVEEFKSEEEDYLENMPEGFKQGQKGELSESAMIHCNRQLIHLMKRWIIFQKL